MAKHYRPTIVGPLVDPDVKAARKEYRQIDGPRIEDPQFWESVVQQERFREVLQSGQSLVALLIWENWGADNSRSRTYYPTTSVDSVHEGSTHCRTSQEFLV